MAEPSVATRVSGDPSSITGALQREVWAIDKDLPITNVRLLSDLLFQRQHLN